MKPGPILVFFLITFLPIGASTQGDFILTKDLTEQFKSAGGTYGSACGIAGQDPELRIETERLIATKDINKLEEWLQTGSNVLNTYGAEALIRLSNTGIDLSEKAMAEISALKESDEKVSSCRGCIYDQITIAEALSPYDFD